jgi:Glycosyl transferase family 2
MFSYFPKYGFTDTHIIDAINPDTFLSVVIPCYSEPDLLRTLNSLSNCDKTKYPVEVIVVINSSKEEKEEVLRQNSQTYNDAAKWVAHCQNEKITFHLIDAKNLPAKHAGVGLARKIGMDNAALRFNEIEKPDGVIVCLDADCTVAANYLLEIENHFLKKTKTIGCSIYFEHELQGTHFSEANYEGIINYELFLRYYKMALYFIGFPYSYHTIGSSMAVRNYVYQKQGGMNKRKAGEDFYFLHKIFPLGNFSELNTTCVYPSPRESLRVPFGTGSAINKLLNHPDEEYCSYNFQTFLDLKLLFEQVKSFYEMNEQYILIEIKNLPLSIQLFLSQNNVLEKLVELKQNSSSQPQYINRFYRWFDGFMVLKFVHFARDNFYANEKIVDGCGKLLSALNIVSLPKTKKELLILMRQADVNITKN